MLSLSIYCLLGMFIEAMVTLSPEAEVWFERVDTAICVVFIYDFFLRFYAAPSKLKFLKWGWIDLISSVPNFDIFRWGRAVRVFRLLRLLRALRSFKVIYRYAVSNQASSTLATAAIISLLLLVFSAVFVLRVETDQNSNIKSLNDALWWAFTTVTTVGYGDKYPVTTAGRVVGVILMIGGVGLFGIFTGFVSSLVTGLGQMRGGRKILSEERAIRAQEDVILERETTIESELQKLTHTVAELQREIRGLQESNLRLTERLGGR